MVNLAVNVYIILYNMNIRNTLSHLKLYPKQKCYKCKQNFNFLKCFYSNIIYIPASFHKIQYSNDWFTDELIPTELFVSIISIC